MSSCIVPCVVQDQVRLQQFLQVSVLAGSQAGILTCPRISVYPHPYLNSCTYALFFCALGLHSCRKWMFTIYLKTKLLQHKHKLLELGN